MSDDTRWRLLLGLGAVPAFFVVVCSILETRAVQAQSATDELSASHALLSPTSTEHFQHHADGDIVHNTLHKNNNSTKSGNIETGSSKTTLNPNEMKFKRYLRQPETWVKLLVTGGGWFIYDVAYCKSHSFFSNLF